MRKQAIFWYVCIFLSSLGLDRITKMWAHNTLVDGSISVLPGLDLTLVWNRGVSFGMFHSDNPYKFFILSFIILGLILSFTAYTFWTAQNNENIIGEMLILSGAFSNIIDRLLYGAVLDFIDFYVGSWHWYTFNIADACVVIGVGIVCLKYIFQSRVRI